MGNKLGMEFALSHFIAVPTIATLSSQADNNYDSRQDVHEFCERINKDSVLENAIQPLKEANLNLLNPKAILITGVTGFLGAHMLYELLEKTDAQIYCLVRASAI